MEQLRLTIIDFERQMGIIDENGNYFFFIFGNKIAPNSRAPNILFYNSFSSRNKNHHFSWARMERVLEETFLADCEIRFAEGFSVELFSRFTISVHSFWQQLVKGRRRWNLIELFAGLVYCAPCRTQWTSPLTIRCYWIPLELRKKS